MFLSRLLARYVVYILVIYVLIGGLYLFGALDLFFTTEDEIHTETIYKNEMVMEAIVQPKEPLAKKSLGPDQKLVQCNNLVQSQEEKIRQLTDLIAKNTTADKKDSFLTEMHSDDLPPSSIYCYGVDRSSRTCRVNNLYYHPKFSSYFLVRGNTSVYYNVPDHVDEGVLDMTSLDGHNVFFWNYVEVPEHTIRNVTVRMAKKRTFILMRFLPGNVMHMLHDDFLGLYFQIKMYGNRRDDHENYNWENFIPFSKDHHIVFMDGGDGGGHEDVFGMLSDNPIRYKSDVDGDSIVCFSDAVVGQSKQVNWYQYGFGGPQGPIPNKTVQGSHIREVGQYALRQLNLPIWNRHVSKRGLDYLRQKIRKEKYVEDDGVSEELVISIFSRKQNRLLLNENDLALRLEHELGLPVVFIRNEDQSFQEQVGILRRSIAAIGMHGSLLIMGIFLPPGAILLELYPYAIPPDDYTPYKTMCSHVGIELEYGRWVNTNTSATTPHPEYPELMGGVETFSEEKKQSIQTSITIPKHECCYNPYWLYRIYQDTTGDLDQIVNTLYSSILRSQSKFRIDPQMSWKDYGIVPAKITNIECIRLNSTLPEALLSWNRPWNYPEITKYEVWVHETYKRYFTDRTELVLAGDFIKTEFSVWIRAYYYSHGTLTHGDWNDETKILPQ